MGPTTASAARKNLYNFMARVNGDCSPVGITTGRGKSAFLAGSLHPHADGEMHLIEHKPHKEDRSEPHGNPGEVDRGNAQSVAIVLS